MAPSLVSIEIDRARGKVEIAGDVSDIGNCLSRMGGVPGAPIGPTMTRWTFDISRLPAIEAFFSTSPVEKVPVPVVSEKEEPRSTVTRASPIQLVVTASRRGVWLCKAPPEALDKLADLNGKYNRSVGCTVYSIRQLNEIRKRLAELGHDRLYIEPSAENKVPRPMTAAQIREFTGQTGQTGR
ncbi:MAG: hypothetical protein ACYCOU_03005 [Sulfobacillus sp.]